MLTGAWIFALLMAGAPLAAIAGSSGGADDDAPDVPEDPAEAAPEEQSHEVALPQSDDQEEEMTLPVDFEFVLGTAGDHPVQGFRPGVDTLTLTTGTWDFDLYDLGDSGEGAGLLIDTAEGTSTLTFSGLSSIPVEDVWLHVSVPGEQAQRVALTDALAPDEEVLQPTDPDAPDKRPQDPSSDPPLAPADPDAPDTPPDDPGGGDVLEPTDPDAPEDLVPVP